MSMYVEKNLRPGEQIAAKARVSLAPMIPTVLISILLLIGSIMVGEGTVILIAFLIIAVMLFLHYIALTSNELGVTNKKIIGKTGIIFNKSLDAYLDKIDNFSVSESFFGKLFGYATIRVCTNSAVLNFPGIKDAMAFKNTVMDCIDRREIERFNLQAQAMSGKPLPLPSFSSQMAPPVPPMNQFGGFSNRPGIGANTCKVCGAPIKMNGRFCEKCGSPQ